MKGSHTSAHPRLVCVINGVVERIEMEQRPIRIAQIIGKMWAGGVESVVFNYYRAIDKNQVQFDFFYDADSTVEPPQDLVDMGARFYKLPPYQRLWEYIPELYRYLRKNNYKIIHSHLNTLSIFPLMTAFIAGVPVRIAHNHSVPSGNEWKRNTLKAFLKVFAKVFATDYFACSEKAGRWLFGNKCFDSGRVTIITNAIDCQRFIRNEEARSQMRSQLGLEENFVVGHVGRLTYAKNHSFLLDVFQKVLESKPTAKLLLVGDGELRSEVEAKIQQLGIVDKVLMVGKTATPEMFYQAMDVVVLPSIFEGLPVTSIEAQFSGTPVIVSEAIPKEAKICDSFKSMSLSVPAEQWAKAAIAISSQQVQMADESKKYDIEYAAPQLAFEYINMADRENKRAV